MHPICGARKGLLIMNEIVFPKAYEGNDPYIFFSYSHRDSAIVIPIVEKMQEAGFRIWYDQGIEAGSEWAQYISTHILNCSVFVALLSDNYDQSPNCHDEVHMAKTYRKDILSIYLPGYTAEMLKGELQLWLGRMQAIFYERHPNVDSFINALTQSKLLAVTNANTPESAITKKPTAKTNTPSPVQFNSSTETLLKRVALFLENEEWSNADTYCEKVLDIDPENPKAYIYKLLAQLHGKKESDLAFCNTSLDKLPAYKTALRFADEETSARLMEYNRKVNARLAEREKERQEIARQEEERKRQAEIAMREYTRQEQERKRKAEQKQREYDSLRANRDMAKATVDRHNKEKTRLQNEINAKQKEIAQMNNFKKMRTTAIAVLVLSLLNVIMLISLSSQFSSGKLLLFVAGLIAAFIVSMKALKASGMSGGLVFLNIPTYGIFSIVTAFVSLSRSKKYQNLRGSKEQELVNLENKLTQINAKINAAWAEYDEAQLKLDSYR